MGCRLGMGFVFGALFFVLCRCITCVFTFASVLLKPDAKYKTQNTKHKTQSTSVNNHDSGTRLVQEKFFGFLTRRVAVAFTRIRCARSLSLQIIVFLQITRSWPQIRIPGIETTVTNDFSTYGCCLPPSPPDRHSTLARAAGGEGRGEGATQSGLDLSEVGGSGARR